MDVSDILNNLNEAQRNAVTSESPHLLVLAGAGSGKTRVIAHRVAWLVQALDNGPHSLLTVTFTNKAANEMKAESNLCWVKKWQISGVGPFMALLIGF